MKNKKSTALEIVRCLPLLIIIAFAVLYFIFRDRITADIIKDLAPKTVAPAVLFMMIL